MQCSVQYAYSKMLMKALLSISVGCATGPIQNHCTLSTAIETSNPRHIALMQCSHHSCCVICNAGVCLCFIMITFYSVSKKSTEPSRVVNAKLILSATWGGNHSTLVNHHFMKLLSNTDNFGINLESCCCKLTYTPTSESKEKTFVFTLTTLVVFVLCFGAIWIKLNWIELNFFTS